MCEVWSVESNVGSVECEAWSGECEGRSAKCGVLLQTVCMQLGILFNIPLAENPTFASSPNGIEAEDLHRLPFVICLRPYFSLHSSFLWLPGAPTSDWLPWSQHCPQCVSTLSVLLHLCCLHWSWYFTLAPGKGIVSHHLSVSSLRCVFCFPSCGYFGTKVFSSFLSVLSPSPLP
jgi:hypothetical protein